MSRITIYKQCDCLDGQKDKWLGNEEDGSGVVELVTCSECGGSGETVWGFLDGDLLDDILDKVNDIKERVDEIKDEL